MIFKCIPFTRNDFDNKWCVLILPIGAVQGWFKNREDAQKWANSTDGLIQYLKHILEK